MCFKIIRILPLLLTFSCTVLEQRSECPCLLAVDLSDRVNDLADSVLLILGQGQARQDVTIPRSEYSTPHYVSVSSRSAVLVNASDNATSTYMVGESLIIPKGEQCPGVWSFYSLCSTTEEEADVKVSLHKNFCGVSIQMAGNHLLDYKLTVYGEVCGYDSSGNPLKGKFEYHPEFKNGNLSYFRIPRQTEPTLRLEIDPGDGRCRTFSLGNYIVQSGYDWGKPDLDDIMLKIDYSNTELSISVDDWLIEENMDIIM